MAEHNDILDQLQFLSTKLWDAHDQRQRAVAERDRAATSRMLQTRGEVVAVAEAQVAEAERIVGEHDAEVERIQKRLAELQPQATRYSRLIEKCKQWGECESRWLARHRSASLQGETARGTA